MEKDNATEKKRQDEPSGKQIELSNNDFRKLNKRFKAVMIVQVIIIILLILNIVINNFGLITNDAVIDAGDGIELERDDSVTTSNEQKVKINLKNTGELTARVSVTGEVYISAMETAYGEEVTKVLDYKYVEIGPGGSKSLTLGTFTVYEDWHYVVKVYVHWNGGSIELSKLLIPT